MSVWRFRIEGDEVRYGEKIRPKTSKNGCNEIYQGRFWCPRMQWFRLDPCPFVSRRECENYIQMCGCL